MRTVGNAVCPIIQKLIDRYRLTSDHGRSTTENGHANGTLALLDLGVATWQNAENHAAETFYPANRKDFRNFEVRLRIHLDKKKAD